VIVPALLFGQTELVSRIRIRPEADFGAHALSMVKRFGILDQNVPPRALPLESGIQFVKNC
jgi:hypothetical protein